MNYLIEYLNEEKEMEKQIKNYEKAQKLIKKLNQKYPEDNTVDYINDNLLPKLKKFEENYNNAENEAEKKKIAEEYKRELKSIITRLKKIKSKKQNKSILKGFGIFGLVSILTLVFVPRVVFSKRELGDIIINIIKIRLEAIPDLPSEVKARIIERTSNFFKKIWNVDDIRLDALELGSNVFRRSSEFFDF